MNTRLAAQPRGTRRRDAIGLVVTFVVWALLTLFVGVSLRDPGHVDHITIDNPQHWRVNVDVTDVDRDGWAGIGGVEREHEQTFHGVLDQGHTWIFRFAYGGEHVEVQLTRFQIEQNNWRVTVPDDFADRLRAAGVPETPR